MGIFDGEEVASVLTTVSFCSVLLGVRFPRCAVPSCAVPGLEMQRTPLIVNSVGAKILVVFYRK